MTEMKFNINTRDASVPNVKEGIQFVTELIVELTWDRALRDIKIDEKPKNARVIIGLIPSKLSTEYLSHNAPFPASFEDAALKNLQRDIISDSIGNYITEIVRKDGSIVRGCALYWGRTEPLIGKERDSIMIPTFRGAFLSGGNVEPDMLVGGLGYRITSKSGQLINAFRFKEIDQSEVDRIYLKMNGRDRNSKKPIELLWSLPKAPAHGNAGTYLTANPWRFNAAISYDRGYSWVPVREKAELHGIYSYRGHPYDRLVVDAEEYKEISDNEFVYSHPHSFYDYFDALKKCHYPIFRIICSCGLELVIAELDFKTGETTIRRVN